MTGAPKLSKVEEELMALEPANEASSYEPSPEEGGVDRSEANLRPDKAQDVVPLVRYDLRILRGLRQIIHGVDLYSKHLSATHQITAPQLLCLLTVVNHGPLSPTAISREVHLSLSTIVGILERLEEKNLVLRERSQEDRRFLRVSATPAGLQLIQQAPSPLQNRLAAALTALPELEQATIALSLERIVALMEAPDTDISPILATGPISSAGP